MAKTMKQLQSGIFKNTKGQFMKELNTLATIAVMKQLERDVLD